MLHARAPFISAFMSATCPCSHSQLIERMQGENIEVRSDCYGYLAEAYAKRGLVDDAAEVRATTGVI